MSPEARAGLVAPALVAVVALVAWGLAGTGWALVVVSAGAGLVIGNHLRHLAQLARWAGGSVDAHVPEARGVWGPVFASIYRRVRMREAVQRDLRHAIARFRQAAEAVPDGIVVLDRAQRIEWANPRAAQQLGLDLA